MATKIVAISCPAKKSFTVINPPVSKTNIPNHNIFEAKKIFLKNFSFSIALATRADTPKKAMADKSAKPYDFEKNAKAEILIRSKMSEDISIEITASDTLISFIPRLSLI